MSSAVLVARNTDTTWRSKTLLWFLLVLVAASVGIDSPYDRAQMLAGQMAALVHQDGISDRDATRGASSIQNAVRLGREGEIAAGIVKNTQRLYLPGGGYRIPDVLSHSSRVIGEVKNVSHLSYTSQIRDFVSFADEAGYTFELWVRPSTTFSGPMAEAIAGKNVVLHYLP